MSLRVFHIFFIALSVTLSAGFGIWALRYDAPWGVALGVVSLALSAGLGFYLFWFIRKIKGTPL